jgi:Avidin family
MEIKVDSVDPRQITGLYQTNVGRAKQKTYPLVGRCDDFGAPDQLVSWVVVWDPPDPPTNPGEPPRKPSITAWVGQYHIDARTEFITTTWLLTRMAAAPEDWESTNVSMDFFFRTPPTQKIIDMAKRVGRVASYFVEPIEPRSTN